MNMLFYSLLFALAANAVKDNPVILYRKILGLQNDLLKRIQQVDLKVYDIAAVAAYEMMVGVRQVILAQLIIGQRVVSYVNFLDSALLFEQPQVSVNRCDADLLVSRTDAVIDIFNRHMHPAAAVQAIYDQFFLLCITCFFFGFLQDMPATFRGHPYRPISLPRLKIIKATNHATERSSTIVPAIHLKELYSRFIVVIAEIHGIYNNTKLIKAKALNGVNRCDIAV